MNIASQMGEFSEKITVCTGFGRNVERHLRDAKIQHSSKHTSI